MKVVQINTAYYLGGSTGKIAKALSEAMLENGIAPLVLYGVNRGEKHDEYSLLIENRLYKRLNELVARIRGNHGFNNVLATKRAIRIIKKEKPDLVHLHNLHGSYINIELLFDYLCKSGIPVVWTLHDCWAFTGRGANYDYNECYKWINGCNACRYKCEYPMTWLIDCCRDNYHRKRISYEANKNINIVTPSNWLAEEVEKSILKDKKVKIINNGVDLGLFHPRKTEVKKEYNIEKMMLAVAYKWNSQKGFEYIKKISKEISYPWTLVVIGVDEKQKKELANYNSIGISNICDGNRLVEYYSAADVFINPTLEDNFPTVNIEALACGTPCVTFDTGGAGEIIDQKTGVLIEKKEWKKMINAATSIDKKAMSDDCVARVKHLYDEKLMAEQYIEIYRKMVE